MNLEKVTRLEVISKEQGRLFVRWNTQIELALQDDGRTLKILLSDSNICPVNFGDGLSCKDWPDVIEDIVKPS